MKLIDTNILIHSAKTDFAYLRSIFDGVFVFRSFVSTIEVLGYKNIQPVDKAYFESIFEIMPELTTNTEINKTAINLRLAKKMSLGDSLIASTALVYGLELYTQNVADFRHISGLEVHNPIVM